MSPASARRVETLELEPGRRERNKREKQTRIVAAARKLFHKKGFAETTTQEIADLADIGSGTLFLYAKSKEDLLILVFKDEIMEIADRAYATHPKSATLIDQVLHIFNAFVAYHKQDLALARALIKEITVLSNPDRRPDIVELLNRIYARLAALIEKAQERGQVRADINPRDAARNFFAHYFLRLLELLGEFVTEAEFRKALRAMLELQLDGIAARTPKSRRS